MPTTGVWMSTFCSSPFLFFWTLMLQPAMTSKLASASRQLTTRNFDMRILNLSSGYSRLPFDAGPALSHVGNTHRKMAVDRNFSKQRLRRAHFRDGFIGKCADIRLNRRKIRHEIRVPHSEDDGSICRMVQQLA